MFSPANRDRRFGAAVFLALALLILLGSMYILAHATGLLPAHGADERPGFHWIQGLEISVGMGLAALFGAIGGVLLRQHRQARRANAVAGGLPRCKSSQ